jgi:hypothetical protein
MTGRINAEDDVAIGRHIEFAWTRVAAHASLRDAIDEYLLRLMAPL